MTAVLLRDPPNFRAPDRGYLRTAETGEWFVRGAGAFAAAEGSALLGVTAAQLHADVDRPA